MEQKSALVASQVRSGLFARARLDATRLPTGSSRTSWTANQWLEEGRRLWREDKAKAVECYRCGLLVDEAHAALQYSLSTSYKHGWGIEQDRDQAFRWCEKAALQGHALAEWSLGCMFEDGFGVVRNYAQAHVFLTRAANQQVADAMYSLGKLYEEGRGVESDPASAVRYYQRAAEQGHWLAKFVLKWKYR